MVRYRLVVEYEGTRFRGWQEQPGQRTVAGVLRQVFEEVLGTPCQLSAAGRTDAGVHALAQVAHLETAGEVSPIELKRRVESRLPADVAILDLQKAAQGFHARHAARARSYLYQVARRRTALAKRFVWWVDQPLELRAVQEALGMLHGKLDFFQFTEQEAREKGTLVVFERAELREVGDLVLFRFVASHFLWKMVRRLVGALVRVGTGELALKDFETLLRGQEVAGVHLPAWTAPPSGLFLERVLYQGEEELGPLEPAVPVAAWPTPEKERAARSREGPRPSFRPPRAKRKAGPGRAGSRGGLGGGAQRPPTPRSVPENGDR